MKNWIALTGLVLASMTFAQTWNLDDGNLTLVGCYGGQEGVYCDFNYTLVKKQTAKIKWQPNNFKIFKQDGVSQEADAVAFGGGKFANIYEVNYLDPTEIIANVPVKVQIFFNIPNSTTNFRALAYNNIKFDNIPVRPYGTAAKVPAQLSAGPNVSGFAISLSNCQLQGQNYVCVATLTPTK
jgi:hypothetical protein